VLHRNTIWRLKSGKRKEKCQLGSKGDRCQVEPYSRKAFDEVEHGLLLHEGTSPFFGIVHPDLRRDVGNMEPHCACKGTRIVDDGGPVPAAFVVSLKRGRGSVGDYDWRVISSN